MWSLKVINFMLATQCALAGVGKTTVAMEQRPSSCPMTWHATIYSKSDITRALNPLGRMKPARFVGRAKDELRSMSRDVQRMAGFEIHLVQLGDEPSDYKPMPSVGPGTYEIRIRDKGRNTPCLLRGEV